MRGTHRIAAISIDTIAAQTVISASANLTVDLLALARRVTSHCRRTRRSGISIVPVHERPTCTTSATYLALPGARSRATNVINTEATRALVRGDARLAIALFPDARHRFAVISARAIAIDHARCFAGSSSTTIRATRHRTSVDAHARAIALALILLNTIGARCRDALGVCIIKRASAAAIARARRSTGRGRLHCAIAIGIVACGNQHAASKHARHRARIAGRRTRHVTAIAIGTNATEALTVCGAHRTIGLLARAHPVALVHPGTNAHRKVVWHAGRDVRARAIRAHEIADFARGRTCLIATNAVRAEIA